MNINRCRHFTGIMAKKCDAGIDYERPLQQCCRGENPTCKSYMPFTAEEIAKDEAAIKHATDLMQRGLSSCCEAPIDESQVIKSGRHKGHGPRFCSKCHRCAFMV
jgi:hypothetical protein